MKESAWRRLEAVVLPALDLEESERRAFLHGRCTGDPTLLRQAESFLAILEGSGGAFLEGSSWSPLLPPAGAETPDPGQLEAGRHIGPYRIEKLLGSGGMGSVYLAERADDTFAKRVALKVVRPGRRSPEAEERFRLERRLLARLEHPNIARLHDAGQTEEGLSYFVMEYVEGRPIDRFAEDEGLGLEARLRLILKVCAAVQVAHRNLVLHRDLKPANILVDGAGEPKLLDFGIGKLLPGEALGEAASLTATAQRPLTPLYASPEQVGGGAVTTATDVYGLGLLLYEVLTGHRPFESSSGSPLALARAIAEEEPALPSRLLEAQADRTYRLDRDLDAILLTALRKEPEQRYASVEQLADDLQRYLDGLPVLARRGNLLYRTGKLIRRHRVAVAAGVLLFLTTFGFAVAMKRQATRTAEERDRAREVESFLVDAFRQADPLATGEIVTARQVLDRGAARLTDRLGPFPETRAALLQSIGEAYLGLGEAQTAEELLRKGLASAQEDLPTDRRVRILAALSVALRMQSLFDESERRAREAVELAESLGEAAHPEPYLATEALAGLLVETQRSPEAEALFLENLERLEQSGSADPENRIRTLEGLSDAHLQQAEYSEALSSLQEALKLREAQPGPQEIGVAMLRLKIANVHLFRGEDREGKTLFEASLPPLVDHLGEEHPTVMTAREALANALTNLGELEAAEGMYRDLLASRIRVFGDRSEAVAMIRHNYAKLLNDRGDHEGAVELARQSLDALVEVMGPDHGEVQMARTSYGNHLMNAGRFKEAQAQLETALASARALEAPLHYGAGFPLEKLGELALAQSRPEEAIPYFEEALAIWQSPPDPRPMRVAYASGKLGRCLRELGRYEEAETHLLRTAKTFDELYPRGHAMRRGIRQGLLALYRLWEKPEDVRLQEALLREEEASGGQGS